MGLVSIGEDEEDRRNEGAHESGGSRVTPLLTRGIKATRDRMSSADMRKVMARQGRTIDALERELKAARKEIERLTKEASYAGWQARTLKRRGLVTDGVKVEREHRIRAVRPDRTK